MVVEERDGLFGRGPPLARTSTGLSMSGATTPGITLTLALSPQGRGDRTPPTHRGWIPDCSGMTEGVGLTRGRVVDSVLG